MLSSFQSFIAYWYFRYLLVTELYMVEKWERVTIHIILLMLFSGLTYFNVKILSLTAKMFGLTIVDEDIIPIAS